MDDLEFDDNEGDKTEEVEIIEKEPECETNEEEEPENEEEEPDEDEDENLDDLLNTVDEEILSELEISMSESESDSDVEKEPTVVDANSDEELDEFSDEDPEQKNLEEGDDNDDNLGYFDHNDMESFGISNDEPIKKKAKSKRNKDQPIIFSKKTRQKHQRSGGYCTDIYRNLEEIREHGRNSLRDIPKILPFSKNSDCDEESDSEKYLNEDNIIQFEKVIHNCAIRRMKSENVSNDYKKYYTRFFYIPTGSGSAEVSKPAIKVIRGKKQPQVEEDSIPIVFHPDTIYTDLYFHYLYTTVGLLLAATNSLSVNPVSKQDIYKELKDHKTEWESSINKKYQMYETVSIAQIETPMESVEGTVQCRKCKSMKVRTIQLQTRSGDEGMTNFNTCLNCGSRFKF